MSDMEGDSGGEDVIEVRAANALVPNLTISVDKEDDNEPSVVEFGDEAKNDEHSEDEENDDDSVKVKVEAKGFPHTKIYENKALKDMGLTPEEARLRKENRSKRFQSPLLQGKEEVGDAVQKTVVDKLLAKIETMNETADADAEIRLNAVHLRGLDDMSTEEIFSFFSDSFPSHIEWIDDTSCNVVWKDETSAACAVLTMTRSKRQPQAQNVTKSGENGQEEAKKQVDEDLEPVKKKETKKQGDDDLDLMESDEETMEVEGEPIKETTAQPSGGVDNDFVENFTNELSRCKKHFHKDGRRILLKLRLATFSDKKSLGGAKKSNYYRKYGNPNYGNVKGLLSRSFMRRFHGRVAKQEYESYQPNADKKTRSHVVEEKYDSAKKVASKRMYSEPEWSKAKKMKRTESGSSSDDSGTEELKEEEKEDLELINSSAKDLSDAIPAQNISDEEEAEEDTMMADRIAKKVEEARRTQDGGTQKSSVPGNSVWARLGRKPNRESQAVKVTLQRPGDSDEDIRRKLPASLRDRLGTKR